MPRKLDLPKKIIPCKSSLKSQKNHDFHSKKYVFQVFRPKKALIKAYDGLKIAPDKGANGMIGLID